jgi:hypothetical protein
MLDFLHFGLTLPNPYAEEKMRGLAQTAHYGCLAFKANLALAKRTCIWNANFTKVGKKYKNKLIYPLFAFRLVFFKV